VSEVADVLGICRTSAYALIRSGKIGYVRLSGGSLRVPIHEVDNYIESNVVRATSA
jgi:excisionase family DNA binding protein